MFSVLLSEVPKSILKDVLLSFIMYKGKESKLFNEDELEKAQTDGWFDNRTDAQKPKADNPPAASGTVTTDASGSGAVTGKI